MEKIKIEILQVVNGKVYVQAVIDGEIREFDSLDKAIVELVGTHPDHEIEIKAN